MKRNQIQAAILIVIVAFPLGLYFFVKFFSTAHFERMPFQYSISASGDTIYHTMPELEFTDQNGHAFNSRQMLGDVYVVSFFDGSEEAHIPIKEDRLNPILLDNLKKIYDNAEDAPMVKLLTISTSPDTDSTEVLTSWSEFYGGDTDKWIFATTSIENVWKLGLETFSLKEFMERNRNRKPFTARAIALIDKSGQVRKYYEGTNDFSIEKQLFEDMRALLTIEYNEDFAKLKKNK